jgi:hypothetical protein
VLALKRLEVIHLALVQIEKRASGDFSMVGKEMKMNLVIFRVNLVEQGFEDLFLQFALSLVIAKRD